jgi:hypothetical protein
MHTQTPGIPWTSADSASLTACPEGDFLARLFWLDGAYINQNFDNEPEALDFLRRNGFKKV